MSYDSQAGASQTPAKRSLARFLPPQHRTSALLFCIVTFFFWAALYLYSPILPVYAQLLGASLSVVGMIVASYALPQLLLRIPMGMWSDALGRRKPLVAMGIVMTLVGSLGLALAPTPMYLLAARTATGIGAAAWGIFAVYFVAFYPREDTGRAIGVINFVQSIGLIMTSLGGGLIAQYLGLRETFFGAAVLAGVSLIALLPASESRSPVRESFNWRSLGKIALNPHLLMVSVMGIFLHFAQFSTVFGFIPVYAAKIGASNADLGIVIMLAQVAAAISALTSALVAEHRGYPFALTFGSTLMCVSLAAVPFISSVPVLEADQFITGLGRGMLSTNLMALSIGKVAPQQRATAIGVFQATYAAGMMLGPLVSGFVADSQGLSMVFYLSAAVSLVITGLSRLPVITRR